MKIIDNKKDFYDYLVSYYGMDDYVVYDRRKSIPLESDLKYSLLSSRPDTFEVTGENIYVCTLVAGENVGQKIFIRESYCGQNRDTKMYMKSDGSSLLTKWDVSFNTMDRLIEATKKLVTPDEPLILSAYLIGHRRYWNLSKTMNVYKNPILKGTPFTSILTPNLIWEGIYNYLLKCKEPKIDDERSDIQHLEAAGFDKKTSFRNIK